MQFPFFMVFIIFFPFPTVGGGGVRIRCGAEGRGGLREHFGGEGGGESNTGEGGEGGIRAE